MFGKQLKIDIVCTPPSPTFLLGDGRGGGLNLPPNFQQGGGRLDRTSILRGGLLEKRGVTSFRGVQFLHKK